MMADIKQKSAPLTVPEPASGLIGIEDTIDEIGQKALAAAQRAEELVRSKREEASKGSGKPVKAAT